MGVFQNNLMGAAAAAASAGGADFYDHQIANSVRLYRAGANSGSKLTRTPGSTGTSRRIYTLSTWIKRGGSGELGQLMTAQESSSTNYVDELVLRPSGENEALAFYGKGGNAGGASLKTNASLRDHSAWYHIMVAVDTTQGTDTNRVKIYLNGELQTLASTTYPAQNYDGGWGNNREMAIGWGTGANNGYPYDGLMAETIYIDGTAQAVTDLGESKNGVWIPKDPSGLTFGDNGFWLKYESSSDLGNDSSGNNNDFSVTNISAHDQMLDSPTFNSSSNGGNFATLNPLASLAGITFTEGNLKEVDNNSGWQSAWSTMAAKSGKFYFEAEYTTGSRDRGYIGVAQTKDLATYQDSYYAGQTNNSAGWYSANGSVYINTSTTGTTLNTYTTNDIVGCAIDIDNGYVYFSKNGTWEDSGNPASGSSGTGGFSLSNATSGDPWHLIVSNWGAQFIVNYGQEGTFAGETTAGGNSDTNGYGNFKYTVPSGYSALCTGALPIANEIDPAQTDDNYPQKLFDAQLWTGDGNSGRSITISGAKKPSLSVIKQRNSSNSWNVWTQGYNSGDYDSFGEFNSDGAWNANQGASGPYTADPTASALTLTAYGQVNANTDTYLNYRWVANGGTTSTNSTGSVNVTQEVDPSGGFSISSYSGAGGTGNIGHGLSSAPTFVIIKQTNGTNSWVVYAKGAQDSGALFAYLDTNSIFQSATIFGNTEPSSTLVYLGDNNEVNHSGRDYLAFCWANVEGYIKSGFYTGNANTDGPYVYTGFKPALVIVRYIGLGESWVVLDNERDGYNVTNKNVRLNSNVDEASGSTYNVDFLSNGFKPRTTWEGLNGSGYRIVYLAMAKNPFKYATAR